MHKVLALAGASMFATVGLINAVDQEGAVPIFQEPRHRVVFESGTTRIHDVQVPPGDTTLYHIHDTPILYVPISRSRTRTQLLGAEWSGGDTSQASASPPATAPAATSDNARRVTSTISYVEKPVTHRVHNVGDGLFRLIALVNRSSGVDGDGPAVAGLTEKPEVLNRYYRAYRVTLDAGESAAPHHHTTPVVIVQQTAGRILIEGSGKAELSEPGKFAYHDGSGTHQVKNLGSASVELIEVELRGGSSK